MGNVLIISFLNPNPVYPEKDIYIHEQVNALFKKEFRFSFFKG